MFLKKLYKFSKTWFILFLTFILFFIYINYKWGMVATPVFQFGMFSSTFKTTDTQIVFKIYVNNEPLNISKLSFIKRDLLLTSLQNYQQQQEHNAKLYEQVNTATTRLGIAALARADKFTNS